MAIESFSRELEYLIRARYSIIYVCTPEEERAFRIIRSGAEKLQMRIVTWTATKGLEVNNKSIDSRSVDFKTALDIAEEMAKEPTLFIWFDLHSFLKGSPVYIRRFREFSQKIRTGLPSNSIIISPLVEIPIELQKEITILDLPLPDLKETEQIIHEFTSIYKERPNIAIDQSKQTIEALARAAVGLSQSEIENCLAKLLVQNRSIGLQASAPLWKKRNN
jgi:hypothetical protein